MDKNEAIDFCSQWLSAWSGNDPEKLIGFYTENALYSDPANKVPLKGHHQIFPYFKKLLAANPDWQWEAVEVFPTLGGFTLKWKATIPVKGATIIEFGLDIVEIETGRIARNEVFFDRTELLRVLTSRG